MKKTLSLVLLVAWAGLSIPGAQELNVLSTSLWDGFDLKLAADKTHRALGYIAPTLGLATYLSMQGGGGEGEEGGGGHRLLGTSAAWAAGLNLGLGLVDHWDRVDLFTDPSKLWSRDALHALVSAAGALCMVEAGLLGGRDGHAAFGEAGTFLMGAAILLEW